MIVLNGYDLKISHGDTLSLSLELQEYTPKTGDIFALNIKRNIADKEPLITQEAKITGQTVDVSVTAEKMKALSPGTYYYDVLLRSGDLRITLYEAARFIVKEVVHNV